MIYKILVIENDPALRGGLVQTLQSEGYDVDSAADGQVGYETCMKGMPDLVVFDVDVPVIGGFSLIRVLRESNVRAPIIVITNKSDEIDEVVYFELGADDCVAKPIAMRSFVARIRARLRTSESQYVKQDMYSAPIGGISADRSPGGGKMEIGNLTIDEGTHEVLLNGKAIEMTRKEFELLAFLARNRGRLFTRPQILGRVWGYEFSGNTRTIDVHVRHIRKKLEDCKEFRIDTIRGLGYKML